jgi:hypothetical protein
MREKNIEKYLGEKVKEAGGLYWKFVSPGVNGVPDRIVILNGVVAFVELKAPGKYPRVLQRYRHDQLRQNKQLVYIIDNKADADNMMEAMLFLGDIFDEMTAAKGNHDLPRS